LDEGGSLGAHVVKDLRYEIGQTCDTPLLDIRGKRKEE
jgi:hypothetical protein